jgi:glyoxylase-like metal-dependent hydrolase (beta-lactamase superfamily II)
VERTGVTAYLHPDDDWLASDPETQLQSIFGFVPPGMDQFAPPERYADLAHGDRLPLAGMTIEVRHTPGHTPGHCVFVVEEGLLFSGDQLFAGSIGRTDLPGGDFETLMHSMETEVLSLSDETRVLPGHGPETTVGRERRANPFLKSHEV